MSGGTSGLPASIGIVPLFAPSREALITRLRLNNTVSDSGIACIDQAIEQVRAQFYRRLGRVRISQLLQMSYTENPTTDDGVLRALAYTTEVLWMRYFLLRSMPTMFADNASEVPAVWNQEGFVRGTSPGTSSELRRLESEIEAALAELQADTTEGAARVAVLEPAEVQDMYRTVHRPLPWPPQ